MSQTSLLDDASRQLETLHTFFIILFFRWYSPLILVVRMSARGARGRDSIPNRVTLRTQKLGGLRFSACCLALIHFCLSVAELSRWLGTQKFPDVDRSSQARQVHINSPYLNPQHTPPYPTCRLFWDQWTIWPQMTLNTSTPYMCY